MPVGKWNLEFGETSCTLGRVFSVGTREASLGFRAEPPERRFSLLLAVPDTMLADSARSIIVSAPGVVPVVVMAPLRAVPLKPGVKRVDISLEVEKLASLVSAKEISIKGAGKAINIQIGGSVEAVTAMTKCEDDLMREWKIDPAALERIATFPKPIDLVNWVSSNDYPAAPQLALQGGTVGALIRIDETGKVQECRVIDSSADRDLDDTTCRLVLMRGHYSPAMDKDGHPVPSWDRAKFRWQIPF